MEHTEVPLEEPVDELEHEQPSAPTFAEIVASLGLPGDAKAVVITPTSAVAIAEDYPEPHTLPETEEAHDGD